MKLDFANKKMSYSKVKKALFPEISKAEFDKIFQNQSYIGSGMQGEVYKANMGNVLVAIKYFRKQFVGVEYINYTQSEIETLRDINNQNIIAFIDSYQIIMSSQYSQRKYCIVCEYCKESLSNYYIIEKLPNQQKLKMCLQLVSAIKAAHQKKIVHRDIKPENILIKDFQTFMVKLADFGCCKISDDAVLSMTKNIGTPLYADPNISSGKYTNKCDIYSVGLVIVYIFCGKHYFSSCETRDGLIESKRKFCIDIPSSVMEFLKRFELDPQIKQFLLQIALRTLSNDRDRLDSDALYKFVEMEMKNYQLMELNKSQFDSQKQSSDSQSSAPQKFLKSQPIDFQEQDRPKIFTKSKKSQETKSIIDEQKKNALSLETNVETKRNEDAQKIDRRDQSIKAEINQSELSKLSDTKSRETTDRLSEGLKLSENSASERKFPISTFETESNNSQNDEFNPSSGKIIQENSKIEEKINQTQTQFNKKSYIKDCKEQEGNSGAKLKNSKNISRVAVNKYNSTILQSNKRSIEDKSKSNERKKNIEIQSKQLSSNEQLCGQVIKYALESTIIKEECLTMNFILKRLKEVKSSFQVIKSIQQVQSYSMTFEQKQITTLLAHCLYGIELRQFLYRGTSKLHANFGKISDQSKQLIQQLVNKQAQKIYPNMKKYANDLTRKVSLIKPKISTEIRNLINDVILCGSSSQFLNLRLNQGLILEETNNFIGEKLKQVKYPEDRKIIEEIRTVLTCMTN